MMLQSRALRQIALASLSSAVLAACASSTTTSTAPVNRSEEALEAVRRAALGQDSQDQNRAETPEKPIEPAPAPEEKAVVDTNADPSFTPASTLKVCPRITARNAPAPSGAFVNGYKPFVRVNGSVRIAVNPTTGGACLTSGFGPRNGRIHKGLDYQSRPAGNVHAAAAGVIKEAGYRDDYGNYVVIDHGSAVFTRYAHLARLGRGVRAGETVRLGQVLGPMGNTASYSIPIHLHYELLTGDYDTPKKSFGLTPVDPFDQPYVN